ncbi:MAG: hypothetical protein ACKV2T_30480, partial [Kofleriaceae bacterium]
EAKILRDVLELRADGALPTLPVDSDIASVDLPRVANARIEQCLFAQTVTCSVRNLRQFPRERWRQRQWNRPNSIYIEVQVIDTDRASAREGVGRIRDRECVLDPIESGDGLLSGEHDDTLGHGTDAHWQAQLTAT